MVEYVKRTLRVAAACSIDSIALAFDDLGIAVNWGVPKEKFMFTLYSRPGSGSAAVEALLAELDLPHVVKDIPRGPDRRTPSSFMDINPRGEIPALRLPDNSLMTESAAMMIYLADLDLQKGFAPLPPSSRRSQYLRWIMYFGSAVYQNDLRYYFPDRYSLVDAASVKIVAEQQLARDFQIFADWLGEKTFILGEPLSAADLYAAMLLSWAPDVDALFAKHDNLKRYYMRIAARPKTAVVWARNEMPVA